MSVVRAGPTGRRWCWCDFPRISSWAIFDSSLRDEDGGADDELLGLLFREDFSDPLREIRDL